MIRLSLVPRLEKLRVNEVEFIRFLRLAFAQKRKTLWNNLKSAYRADTLREALQASGVKPNVRAEALPLDKSAALFRALLSRDGAGPS